MCSNTYPLVGDIPDLRIDAPSWVEPDADLTRARELMALAASSDAATLAHHVFARRPGWTPSLVSRRSEQTRALPGRMARELEGWLKSATTAEPVFLDLGCGSGAVLAAAARKGRHGIGIDVSLEWLVVARQIILEHGGIPILAAAMAEALPLADGSMGAVVSLDVVEHVGNRESYAREIDRVLKPGGVCAMATPNRFSLTAEPHVSVWGVGWIPRAWQPRFVHWRNGRSYEYCTLLSLRGLRRLLTSNTSLDPSVLPGIVAPEELLRFSVMKSSIARAYNRAAAVRGLRAMMLPVCPFFRVIARKPST